MAAGPRALSVCGSAAAPPKLGLSRPFSWISADPEDVALDAFGLTAVTVSAVEKQPQWIFISRDNHLREVSQGQVSILLSFDPRTEKDAVELALGPGFLLNKSEASAVRVLDRPFAKLCSGRLILRHPRGLFTSPPLTIQRTLRRVTRIPGDVGGHHVAVASSKR